MVYAYKLAEDKVEKVELLKKLIHLKKEKFHKLFNEITKLDKEYWELII